MRGIILQPECNPQQGLLGTFFSMQSDKPEGLRPKVKPAIGVCPNSDLLQSLLVRVGDRHVLWLVVNAVYPGYSAEDGTRWTCLPKTFALLPAIVVQITALAFRMQVDTRVSHTRACP